MSKYLNKAYTTKEGSVLTPIRYFTRNQKGRYVLECSVCSLDTELFPAGSIETSGDSIRQGCTVCGCNVKGFRYSEVQYKVLVDRECKVRGYIFEGFKEESCKAMGTHINLYNPITRNRWSSTTIQAFLNGTGDPKAALIKTTQSSEKPCKEFIDRFNNTGRFLLGTTFIRSDKNIWKYICPSCSTDEYVMAGVCSGVFSGTTGHLSSGKRSCRCGKPKWTKEQREYQIYKILTELGGGEFISWIGEFIGNRTKFKWKCSDGHENETILCNFFKRRKCKTCFANGFKNYLPARLYLTKWEYHERLSVKYGITNLTVASREQNQGKVTKFLPENIYEFYHEDGKVVEGCEKEIKKTLGGYFLSKEEFPRGYSETLELTEENITTILNIIEKYNLKRVVSC